MGGLRFRTGAHLRRFSSIFFLIIIGSRDTSGISYLFMGRTRQRKKSARIFSWFCGLKGFTFAETILYGFVTKSITLWTDGFRWQFWGAFQGQTQISADPGLGQGRGGAWDHRRCGTSPSSLSTVKPILQPSSHINSFCRLPALKPSKLHPAANSHPAPHINRFLWPLLHPTATPRPHINGFLWASKSAVCQP